MSSSTSGAPWPRLAQDSGSSRKPCSYRAAVLASLSIAKSATGFSYVGSLGGPNDSRRCPAGIQALVRTVSFMGIAELPMDLGVKLTVPSRQPILLASTGRTHFASVGSPFTL